MMKPTLFIACFLSLFLFSCKKKNEAPPSSPTPKNIITFSVDGVVKKYTVNVTASLIKSSNSYALNLEAYISADLFSESISLGILTNTPVVTGTYKNDPIDGFLLIDYYGSEWTIANQHVFASDRTSNHLSSLTITSISSTNVKGTFSGQLIDATGNVKSITDGSFDIDINK